MKKCLLLIPFLFLLTIAADANIYLRGGLFYSSAEDISVQSTEDFVTSASGDIGFNLAAGYKFSYLRLEGEFSVLNRSIGGDVSESTSANGSFDRKSVFANVLLEIPATPFFEPYIGAGIGFSEVGLDLETGLSVNNQPVTHNTSISDTTLSFQLMLGIRFSLQDRLSVYAGYRYFSAEAITFSEEGYQLDADNGSGLFELGVGFGF